MRQKLMIGSLIGIMCFTIGTITFSYIRMDKKAPKIECSSKDIIYDASKGTEQLLNDVKAQDDRDGDVTKGIQVIKIEELEEKGIARVTYAVEDSSKNCSTLTREVKMLQQKTSPNKSEQKKDEVKVDNTKKDEVKAEQTVEADKDKLQKLYDAGKPIIELKQNTVTINAGDSFNLLNYVKSVKDSKDSVDDLSKRINITGNYSTKTAGRYELKVFVIDSDRNESNVETFTLIVK